MTFTSFNFMAFLAVVALLYYIVPKKIQWSILLLASYGFYLSCGVKQVAFIISTTLLAYISGLIMQKMRDKNNDMIAAKGDELSKEEKRDLKKKINAKIHRVQVLTALIALGILAFVKYANFVIENVNDVFAMFQYDINVPFVNVIVPLGISFYTFQSIGYIIDIGRGKYRAERHLGKFALFVSFFPSVVQGPINRFDDLGAQINQHHKFDYTKVKFGVQLILWGMFKKLVIADRMSIPVQQIFKNYGEYSGGAFIFAMLGYAVQIYADFSGGIDIARGAAEIFGITLPQNFERPYFSTSLAEYWRRWHASLGAWMREYVFYPVMLSKPVTKLSKFCRARKWNNVAKMVPSVITPFVVFTLIGVWHGAQWKYVAFGLYNATIVASSVALAPLFKKMIKFFKINTETFSWKLFCIFRTFFICCIGKIFGQSQGLYSFAYIVKTMFTDPDPDFLFNLNGELYTLGLDRKNMFVLLIAVLVLLTVSILQENGIKMRETISKQNILFRWILYIGIIVVIAVFGMYGPSYDATTFLYQAY